MTGAIATGAITTGRLGPTAAPPSLTPEQIAKTRQSASDFESMALSEMLKPMFETVDTSKGMFGGGAGEATWRPMIVDEMAKSIARSGGLGIGDAVFRQLLQTQEHRDD